MGILKILGRAAKWVGKKVLSTAVIWGPALIGVGIGLAIGGPLAVPLALAMGAAFGYMGMRWKTRQLQQRNAAQAEEAKNSAKQEKLQEPDPRSKMDPKEYKTYENFERLMEFEKRFKEFQAYEAFKASRPQNSGSPAPESHRDSGSENLRTDSIRSQSPPPAPRHSADIARRMPTGFSPEREPRGRGGADASPSRETSPDRRRNSSKGRK
ncbi:hypothetical protein ACFVGN_32635 [Streptomyces sp. NPDC057757]|uniref:hypothetical protein n=1 Tax=Streptomyces sp. NPDC057757 TaxID=3346241 RepID=UPI003689361A